VIAHSGFGFGTNGSTLERILDLEREQTAASLELFAFLRC
jgi:hypothetical protein